MADRSDRLYEARISWTGNLGSGTRDYRSYARDHTISCRGKPEITGSSDPVFRGDSARYSPEELFVAALSACHMLWYLHLCADAGITVHEYSDTPEGRLKLSADGRGYFDEVTLRPAVGLEDGADFALAEALHRRAHRMCFLASSVNCPVTCDPVFRSASPPVDSQIRRPSDP